MSDVKPVHGHSLQESYNLLCRAINESNCSEGCDSYSHADDCETCNPSALIIRLTDEIRQRDAALDVVDYALTNIWAIDRDGLKRAIADALSDTTKQDGD